MDGESDIKVNLDTSLAKRQFDSLGRKGARMFRRVGSSAMRRAGNEIGIPGKIRYGIGAISGYAGVQRLLKNRASVDPWEAALIPWRASIKSWMYDRIGYNPEGRKAALSKTASRMSMASYGGDIEGARDYYGAIAPVEQDIANGHLVLRQTMKGPSLMEVFSQNSTGTVAMVEKAFEYWYNKIK